MTKKGLSATPVALYTTNPPPPARRCARPLPRASDIQIKGPPGGRGRHVYASPPQKMFTYWPMRPRWSCVMHSAIHTMLRTSCSFSFTKA